MISRRNVILFFLIIFICIFFVCFRRLNGFYFLHSVQNQYKASEYAWELVHKTKSIKGTNDVKILSWNKGPKVHNWSYCDGLMMKALLRMGYKNFVDEFYNDNINDDGSVNNTRNFRNIYVKGTVDDVAPAYTLFDILKSNNSDKYKNNLDKVYGELSKQPVLDMVGGNYYHKINNRAWINYPFALDGLYMALPFELRYKKMMFSDDMESHYSLIFNRLDWVSKHLKNKNGLYNHGCKSDGKTMNGVVWSRGVGWYAMAQVAIIELFPEGSQKEILKTQLKDFFDGMISYQDSNTGMWKNVIYPEDNISGCNKFETSGTSMMAYALMKAYINNFVTDDKYAYAGLKAFNGVTDNKLESEGFFNYSLNDIYKMAIVNDYPLMYNNCSYYVKDDPKGSAPFILASSYVSETVSKLLKSELKKLF